MFWCHKLSLSFQVQFLSSFGSHLLFAIPFRLGNKCVSYNNNNNRLFIAPHLVRAQRAYKDTKIHSLHRTHARTHARTHTHTHTHTHNNNNNKYTHYWCWIGKTTDQYRLTFENIQRYLFPAASLATILHYVRCH